MTVKTEGQRAAEFLLREGNGSISREVGTLTAGQSVLDGQAVSIVGGKLVGSTGAHNTAGVTTETVAGIVIGDWTVAADTVVPYIARIAEVKNVAVIYHTGGVDALKTAAVKAALALKFIIPR